MSKTHSQFAKNVKKLDNYLVLREDSKNLVVANRIKIQQHRELLGNIFQPYSKNEERSFCVCFVICMTGKPEDASEWKDMMEILYLLPRDKKANGKELQNFIDSWVVKTYS